MICINPSTLRSFFSLSITLSDDAVHPVTENQVPFYDINIRCMTNAVNYGDGTGMEDYLSVGDVAYFRNGNLGDIFIKNKTAGSNGKVVITGTVPTDWVKEKLKWD